MGTASSNKGPSGPGGLLPSWYPSDGPGGAPAPSPPGPPVPDGLPPAPNPAPAPPAHPGLPPIPLPAIAAAAGWPSARRAINRFADTGTGTNLRNASRNYSRTLGGSLLASRASTTGISAGRGLATFLGGVSAAGAGGGGLAQTVSNMGIATLDGQSPEFVLAKIADSIAPPGATNDEAVAREAVLSTLDRLYMELVNRGDDLSALEALTPERIKDVIIEYTSCYIYKKWVYELGISIEKNAVSERQALDLEVQMKDFIRAEVQTKFRDVRHDQLDLANPANQATIEYIFQLAYSTLES